ncbi:T9SS type A sorting domain-containing protein [Epilithonimonas pallida]|uniref:Pectate lyase n=1 Tax=Epilithonimonas pallida TaxID=373671 RepID=A0ABY1QXG4_9FLAO|nr:T9SS type A sorting domain-containing protein [Epilithonimonas pallida]SMP86183.1 pectate lyase [Epilithonimonas pallida]
MKRIFLILTLLTSTIVTNLFAQCNVAGWASTNGVTGGGTAAPTVVTTYAELRTAVNSTAVKVIHVSGQITFPSAGRLTLNNQTNKSILGLAGARLISTDLTAGGSGILTLKNSSNVLIKNITFEGPGAYDVDGNDNMTIDNCTNVWVDHCTFQDALDGNLDIKNGSDLITISWTKFEYLKAPIPGGSGGSNDHRFSNLFGSSDSDTQDSGKLRITMQYCWWGNGVRERMPRVRYGKVHLLNNYFNSSVSNYCIYAGYQADLLIESNYFEGVKNPIRLETGNFTAAQLVDNTFVGTSGTATGSGTAFTPPYSINKIASQDVKQTVMTGAGAVLLQSTDCVFLSTNEINSKSKSDFLFYPNPASEQIFLKAFSGNSQSIKINVTDISGKSEGTIYQGNFRKGNNTVNSISIKKLSKGVKIFEVKTDKDSYTQKVIVK